MSDASRQAKAGKRERLVTAARDVIHRQGVERTTLADVAQAADVPVGNVYYYFKTKDDLVKAAIESQVCDIDSTLRGLERHRSPEARLKGFIKALCDQADTVAHHGCPLGSLCSELDKRDDGVERVSARLLQLPITWLTEQFRAMGRPDADELAIALMAAYQGVALLTNTFRDPSLMTNESRRLQRWIDSLA
jgi:AcrR family transcriptional regulator